jgi:hypothetical protein
MSATVIEIASTEVVVEVSNSPVIADSDDAGITVSLVSTPVVAVTQTDAPIVIEIGMRGLTGPAGADPDYVWPIKPDLSEPPIRDAEDRIIRLNYVDGTYKVFTYAGELLVTVSGLSRDGDTVTKTLTYDAEGLWTGTTTVVT